jgi:Secretion system C-terminal sorting domain
MRQLLLVAGLLLCVLFTGIAQPLPDPGLPGPHTVIKKEYNLGDGAYYPPSFSPHAVEVRGSVHYPADLANGPYPVIVFLHGRHSTCYDTLTFSDYLEWPCSAGHVSITSYEGYDYAATTLASHGYIVISVSCNCINAYDNSYPDYGMQARAELMQYHLMLWDTFNTVGRAPFDSLFVGRLDMNNIGTMGHSRGGEGVVYHALYNRSLDNPFGIKAVITLAPVDFNRKVLNGIPLLDIAPYCDGDVSDLQGLHYYDDARYADSTDITPKHTILFMGANHNFFNTVWTPYSYPAGGADDWFYTGGATDPQCGPSSPTSGRFDTTTQKNTFNTYGSAFYRLYLGHENAFAPILNVDSIKPPPSATLADTQVFVSVHPGKLDRLDINRVDSLDKGTVNTLGGAVTDSDLVSPAICGGGYLESDCSPTIYGGQKPHYSTYRGLSQMGLQWSDRAAWYENDIPPAYENVTKYSDLIFRATVNFVTSTPDSNLNFTVELMDSAGNTNEVNVSSYSKALFYQPGTQAGDLPKMVFNTVKIPLSAFSGVALSQLRKIRFKFDDDTAGAIYISDLAFSRAPCAGLSTHFYYDIKPTRNVYFLNASTSNAGDSVVYHWNFGDSTSGAADTSSLKNPNHIYYGYGTFNPCLRMTAYMTDGFVCVDSFCSNVTLTKPADVALVSADNITIVPNPTTGQLHISGATSTDVFQLINLVGQTVYSCTLTQADIQLPGTLPAGVYCVVITTANGKIYKKIVLNR